MNDNKRLLTEHCYECGNCMQKCPVNAVRVEKVREVICLPVIDTEKCINCGLCSKVCQSCEPVEKSMPAYVYAAVSKSQQSIYSTSGGIFYELAAYIIKNGGCVIGAGYAEDWTVKQMVVSDIQNIQKLQGSKYVKSNVSESYGIAYNMLKENKLVLYSGTPCQIAGLKKYLDYSDLQNIDNLLTVDIICHGTPPVCIFQDYINFLSARKGGQLIKFSFRNKKYGHKHIGEYEIKRNSSIKKYRLYSSESSYFSLFLKGYIYNAVCYSCPYACNERISDITLGDFWGIKKEMPEFFSENSLSDETSVSSVMINTDKGESFFKNISCHIICKSVDYEKVVKHNPQLSQPVSCDQKVHRELFDYYKEKGYENLDRFYKSYSDCRKYSMRISSYIPTKIKQGIKRLIAYPSSRK